MGERNEVQVIYTNWSKVLDKVSHSIVGILVENLEA